MNITYKVTMHSYWHCGSGLAAGADVDALAIKDKDGLPYIPGKTMKGLIREAMNEIIALRGGEEPKDYVKLFGYLSKNGKERDKSESFFSNAMMEDNDTTNQIKKLGLQQYLYESVANTAIDEKTGTAKEHSLRKMEVAVPITLEGRILNVPESMESVVLDAMRFIKNLGANRNRGLGRCTIEGRKEEEA
ncbi:MAG: RAMP superfamily CRISPR-associated protein [Bacteroidaceae bacterium]|nr:RAMP superfamily CRISPR-associated protein [Bacteroidaceae bacterium]